MSATGANQPFIQSVTRRPATAAEVQRLQALAGGWPSAPPAVVIAVDAPIAPTETPEAAGAEAAEALVALVAAAQHRQRHHLHALYVEPAFRRRGVATWLAREHIDGAIRANVPLIADSRPDAGLTALYRRLGFVPAPAAAGRMRLVFSL